MELVNASHIFRFRTKKKSDEACSAFENHLDFINMHNLKNFTIVVLAGTCACRILIYCI